MLVLDYPLDLFDFRPWARETLGIERLEELHRLPDPVPFTGYIARLNYYANMLRDNFAPVLDQYLELAQYLAPLFDGIELRQRPPTFRCHLAGAGTASAFHRDGDAKYGVSPGIINAWVPLTEVGGNNSIHIESAFGSEDYHPVALAPGELLIFDAYHLKHGSHGNDTNVSRISFDFRFIPTDRARARVLDLFARDTDLETEGAGL